MIFVSDKTFKETLNNYKNHSKRCIGNVTQYIGNDGLVIGTKNNYPSPVGKRCKLEIGYESPVVNFKVSSMFTVNNNRY